MLNITVTSGVGGGQQTAGTDSVIPYIMRLGGGNRGLENSIGTGGTLTFPGETSGKCKVTKTIIRKNGYNGVIPPNSGSAVSGANSVLTNSGGGLAHANATALGAGGGGGYAWNFSGGSGGGGEVLIRYEKLRG